MESRYSASRNRDGRCVQKLGLDSLHRNAGGITRQSLGQSGERSFSRLRPARLIGSIRRKRLWYLPEELDAKPKNYNSPEVLSN